FCDANRRLHTISKRDWSSDVCSYDLQTFLQNASHELKTPLMTIQGYAEGIRDGIFTGQDMEKGLNVVTSEVNRLKTLINEMTLQIGRASCREREMSNVGEL